jgi:putative two-component system response regulator
MNNAVLFIDDEVNILNSIKRVFADHDFILHTASSARKGLEILSRNEIAVVITDNKMPGMNGLDLLRLAKVITPDTIRIMLTGHASLDTAIDAINSGEVFRFVVKPWNDKALEETLEDALQRYHIVKQLQYCDESVMLSIAQTIELKDSYTRGHCDRVANYAIMISRALGLPEETVQEIKHGSWLHDCGKIGIPGTILNSSDKLDASQYEIVKKHCLWGAEVARQARLPSRIINIILYHHEKFMGGGYPAGLSGSEIPLEARIVAVADAYDALTSNRPYHKAIDHEKAQKILAESQGTHLDPDLVALFCQLLSSMEDRLSTLLTRNTLSRKLLTTGRS